jgi:hypothetical protein
LQIERFAEDEHVRTVGERHIARLLVEFGSNNAWGFLGLNPQHIYDEVRKLELGPDFTQADLQGWHGIIDTNAVLKSRERIWEINWREVSASADDEPVTVWISTVTLHELDVMPLRYREPDLRRKASAFAAWFNDRVQAKSDLVEIPLGDGVRFKFWKASPAVTADTQILESANDLRDKGLKIVVITHDMDLRLRAIEDDFEVAGLPKKLLVSDVEGSK